MNQTASPDPPENRGVSQVVKAIQGTIQHVTQIAGNLVVRVSPWALIATATVLAGGLISMAVILIAPDLPDILPTPTVFAPAGPDETLIIGVPFAGGLSGLEVHPENHVRDALQDRTERLVAAGISTRLEMWSEPVSTQQQARAIGEQYSATLVVWGELEDVAGARVFVEILHELPRPDVQQEGNLLPLVTFTSNQVGLRSISRECLTVGLPRQADYLTALSLGLIELIQQRRDVADGLFTEAIQVTQAGTDCRQVPTEALYWRGFTRSLQERFPEARADLDQALALDPEFVPAWVQRGIVLLAMGHAREAQVDFETALNGTDVEDQAGKMALLGNLGVSLMQQGDLTRAEHYVAQSLQLDSEVGDPVARACSLLQRGALYHLQGKPDQARETYQRALAQSRETGARTVEAVVLGNLGVLAHADGKIEDALDLYRQALAITDEIGYRLGSGRQLNRIGRAYLDQGQAQAAVQSFRDALEIHAAVGSTYGEARSRLGLGMAQYELGHEEAALEDLNEALRLLQSIGSPDAETVRQAIQ